jgi:hypothetical protein
VTTRHARDQRGLVFPSPVVILSVIAVVMAGVAFIATRGGEPTEREITTVSREHPPTPTPTPELQEPKPAKPRIDRKQVYVEVYNNSGVTGLASRVAARASIAGWQVVGEDNWYGTIPATTVYYPRRLKAAAELLALDLGSDRVAPAVNPMRLDRLTLILTGPLG